MNAEIDEAKARPKKPILNWIENKKQKKRLKNKLYTESLKGIFVFFLE